MASSTAHAVNPYVGCEWLIYSLSKVGMDDIWVRFMETDGEEFEDQQQHIFVKIFAQPNNRGGHMQHLVVQLWRFYCE